MKGKRRFHSKARTLRRKSPSLEPQPRILIVCEGSVTEPQYFKEFVQMACNPLVSIVIDDRGGAPKTLVERAAEWKKRAFKESVDKKDVTLRFEEVWCVYDVDVHPKLNDALQQARDNEINLAISNPCFELWFLLHFIEQNAHIERKPASDVLKTFVKGYKKYASFNLLQSGYNQAVKRAQNLENHHIEIGSAGGNPSTGVYKLTEQILEFSRKERLKKIIARSK